MTAFDLDPVFSLGLKLMHSKSRDSAEQLRVILEEVTKQKYGGSNRLLPSMKRLAEERYDSKKSGSVEVSSKSSTKSSTTMQQTTHHQVSSAVSSPVSPHSKTEEITASSETITVLSGRHVSDGSDSDDVDDLALEILEEDLMCVVCRGMDVGARNRLVECVECHSLYHQECHKPPIQEAHASDPRRVWTCSACSKPTTHQPPAPIKPSPPVKVGGGKPISSMTTKKVEVKSPSSSGGGSAPQVSSKSGSSSSSSKSSYSSSSSKSGSSSSSTKASSSSKNADISSSSKQSALSSSSGSSSGGGGSGSGSSSSSSSTSKASSSKIAHADKRIQIMKKKAAKLQEKRKLSK